MGKNRIFKILFLQYTLTTWWFRGKKLIINDFWTNFNIQSFETLHHFLWPTQFRHKFQINLPFWNCSIYRSLETHVFKSVDWRCKKSERASFWKQELQLQRTRLFAILKKNNPRTDLKSSNYITSMAKEHYMQMNNIVKMGL